MTGKQKYIARLMYLHKLNGVSFCTHSAKESATPLKEKRIAARLTAFAMTELLKMQFICPA
ncbi:MAG TPA: hypothetical protein DEQ65_05905 [Ruminococcaceae bacterium]|nr:hypothetical protein [Oscillospiraceae bacterium]